MSAVLEAIAEERRTVLELCSQMPDSMWAKDSGCSGWSVQDLVSHMACSFWLAVDPSALPDPGDLPAERAADIYVESRRSMTPQEVVADYESVSARGLEVLAAIEGQDVDIPIGESAPIRRRSCRQPSSSKPSSTSGTTFVLRVGRCKVHRRPSTSYGSRPPSIGSKRPCRSRTRVCSTSYRQAWSFASTACALGPSASATTTMSPRTSRLIRKPSCGGLPSAVPGKAWAFKPKGIHRL